MNLALGPDYTHHYSLQYPISIVGYNQIIRVKWMAQSIDKCPVHSNKVLLYRMIE